MRLAIWLKELRAPFFTASIVPVLLGTAVAWHTSGEFNLLYFIATLIAGMSLHAGANVSNDYFDFKNGSDNINTEFIRPFCGGSRMIQDKIMSPREVLIESIVCYVIAVAIGIWLIYERGPMILILGIIGAFFGFFYTAPPFKFVSRGIGEIVIALNFGVLMTLGTFFVQTGSVSLEPIIASLPIAILIALILYINEFPDYSADKRAGKRHLVVRLGKERAAILYAILLAAVYLVTIAGIVLHFIPLYGLFTLITLPLAIFASIKTLRHFDDPKRMISANIITIQLHLFIGLILSASYIISGLFGA